MSRKRSLAQQRPISLHPYDSVTLCRVMANTASCPVRISTTARSRWFTNMIRTKMVAGLIEPGLDLPLAPVRAQGRLRRVQASHFCRVAGRALAVLRSSRRLV